MKPRTLKATITKAFSLIIVVLAVLMGVLGFYVIKEKIVARAQSYVKNSLRAAETMYQREIEYVVKGFALVEPDTNLALLKTKLDLDYIGEVTAAEALAAPSEIVRAAFTRKKGVSGTRLIDKYEMMSLGYGLYAQRQIPIVPTPKARPTTRKVLDTMMAIEYALPIIAPDGTVEKVIYGGTILNRDLELVDRIRDAIFENKLYKDKPIGTVTIFLDDVRIATNVLNEKGERAIGTRVSQIVYENVVEKGHAWIDRAFVVTNWYLTAYEPIRNIQGAVIGILYVGTLEEPFVDLLKNVSIAFVGIVVLCIAIAALLTMILAAAISRPLRGMLDATCQIYGGDFRYTVPHAGSIKELNALATSFNAMAAKLDEREKSLTISNEKLAELNKSYLDLIGFVAHELKGILSSTILNAYAVRDGFLGMVNFKQQRALDSVTRNLDYLTSMVKNYLDLSRIEKGELAANKRSCSFVDDILQDTISTFEKRAEERQITVETMISDKEAIVVDVDLLKIVMNNLVGNALKYGVDGGRITISAHKENGWFRVCVYNDGTPLNPEECDRLFQKFSRLENKETRRAQGTGLGLFITKKIITKHGGEIWVSAQEQGNTFCFKIPLE